jgi:hypothetical protein
VPDAPLEDDPSIEGHHGVLRHSSSVHPNLQPIFDPKLGRRRAPTPAFLLRQDKKTGQWEETLSVDLEESLRQACLPLRTHITPEQYLARCAVADVRELGFGVIPDPIPGNPQHGGITGINPAQRERAARALARKSQVID